MRKLRLWILILPFLLHYFGAALNILVITCNHGMMPVHLQGWLSAEDLNASHCQMTHETHLNWIADWVTIFWEQSVESPGDIFIQLGEWLQPYGVGAWFALLIESHTHRRD